MPSLTATEQFLLFVSTCSATQLAALPGSPGRFPLPLSALVKQAASDRLALAGEHLRLGDEHLLDGYFRSSISRHYYAMYHAGRAVVYAMTLGDDHERHSELPKHLPSAFDPVGARQQQLSDARLLRNEADYNPYPARQVSWEIEARQLASSATDFVSSCEDFALMNGLI